MAYDAAFFSEKRLDYAYDAAFSPKTLRIMLTMLRFLRKRLGAEIMNITVIGTGYVGLVSGICYAELGNHVVCVDKDLPKVETLQNGGIPIYEPGLQELSDKNMAAGRLSFTSDLNQAVKQSDIVILAVGTPSLPNGEANLSYIDQAAVEIAQAMNGYKIIAVKSTVPVGTNERVRNLIRSRTVERFDSISLPEFLREGSAVQDTLHPDRIVIGADSQSAAETIVRAASSR